MISQQVLQAEYVDRGRSLQEIATSLTCSVHQVRHWMDTYGIKRRSISEAVYRKHNPSGDPFSFSPPKTLKDARLFGLGIGLYWGEGTKADRMSVRLGNTDPNLIDIFINFLVRFYQVKRQDFRFGLQIFHDQILDDSIAFWTERLAISQKQFYKPTVTISVGKGTYRKKTKYGVLTVYYHNKKLRDIIVKLLPT